jgi:hypothetical protein
MNMRSMMKMVGVVVAAGLLALACGGNAGTGSTPVPRPSMAATASRAADLRTKLDLLLGEHMILASKATDAALGGRTAEFQAYGGLLNQNGTDIGAMIGTAFGSDAQSKFNQIWSAHDGFFVDYTTGVATGDKAKQDTAVQDLTTQYIPQLSDLLSGATGLPKDTIAGLLKDHVLQTKRIVDEQAAKSWTAAYTDLRNAYAHMEMIGDPLAEAIVKKKPGLFPGDAAGKPAQLRANLNTLLQEHLYLATMATGAALGGRTDEFQAAGTALNANGTDIGSAIGSLYGTDAQTKFNQIWSAHNGFFVDYTTGVAKGDKTAEDKAVQDLTTRYVPQFSDFISGATGLPQGTVANLTRDHVLTTKAVVDAQGAKDTKTAGTDDRMAAQHMQMIADPLAAAIVKKLPGKF